MATNSTTGASRRIILGGLVAALPSVTIPALAAAADPVIALAAAEKAAWDAFGNAAGREDEAEQAMWAAGYRDDQRRDASTPEVVRHNEAQAQWTAAQDAWEEAARHLVSTVPTTAAGAIAMIDRFETYTGGCMIGATDNLDVLFASLRSFLNGRA